jgi:hypothetical protein
MINFAKDIRNQWEKEEKRKEEKHNKAILKSKRRNKFFMQLEYLYLLAIINYRARIFNLSGYTRYTNYYRFGEETIKKLENNGFNVWTRDWGYGCKLQINW